jgi:hypothetical protein
MDADFSKEVLRGVVLIKNELGVNSSRCKSASAGIPHRQALPVDPCNGKCCPATISMVQFTRARLSSIGATLSQQPTTGLSPVNYEITENNQKRSGIRSLHDIAGTAGILGNRGGWT